MARAAPEAAQLQQLRRANNRSGVGAARKTVDGHAEAAITVMREFFQTRPLEILVNVFRDHDRDHSGAIELDEFKRGLRSLNLDLSDRDMAAMFRAADQDTTLQQAS